MSAGGERKKLVIHIAFPLLSGEKGVLQGRYTTDLFTRTQACGWNPFYFILIKSILGYIVCSYYSSQAGRTRSDQLINQSIINQPYPMVVGRWVGMWCSTGWGSATSSSYYLLLIEWRKESGECQ
jgi:hypothetical protein